MRKECKSSNNSTDQNNIKKKKLALQLPKIAITLEDERVKKDKSEGGTATAATTVATIDRSSAQNIEFMEGKFYTGDRESL